MVTKNDSLHSAELRARHQVDLRDEDWRRHDELAQSFGDGWERMRGYQIGRSIDKLPKTVTAEEVERELLRKRAWQQLFREYMLDAFRDESGKMHRPSVRVEDFPRLERIALAQGVRALHASTYASQRTKQLSELLARGPLAPALGARLVESDDRAALAEASRGLAAQLLVCRGGLLHMPRVVVPPNLFLPRLRELVALGRPWRAIDSKPLYDLPCPHDAALPFRDTELLLQLEGSEAPVLDCECNKFRLVEYTVTLYQQVTLGMLNVQNWRERRSEHHERLLVVLRKLMAQQTPLRQRELCAYAFVLVQHDPARWAEAEMWAFYDAIVPALSDVGRRQLQGWCFYHALSAKHAHVVAPLAQRGCDFSTLRCGPAGHGPQGTLLGDTCVHVACRLLDEEEALTLLQELVRLGAPTHAVRRDYECDLAGRADLFEEPIAIAAGRGHKRVVSWLTRQPRPIEKLVSDWVERGFVVEQLLTELGDGDNLALCDERLVALVGAQAQWLLADARLVDEPLVRRSIKTLLFGQRVLLRELDHYNEVVKPEMAELPADSFRRSESPVGPPERAREWGQKYLHDLRALIPSLFELGSTSRAMQSIAGDRAVMSIESFMGEMASRLTLWGLPRLTQLWLTSGAQAAKIMLDVGVDISAHERSTLAALLLEHKSRSRRSRSGFSGAGSADHALFEELVAPARMMQQPQVVSRLILAAITFGADSWLKTWCTKLEALQIPLWQHSRTAQRICLRVAVERHSKLLGWLLERIEPAAIVAECSATDEQGDTLVHQLMRLPESLCYEACAHLPAEALAGVCSLENASGITAPYEAIAQGRPEMFVRLGQYASPSAAWAALEPERLQAALWQRPAEGLAPLLALAHEAPDLHTHIVALATPLSARLEALGHTAMLSTLRGQILAPQAARQASESDKPACVEPKSTTRVPKRLPQTLEQVLAKARTETTAQGLEAALAYIVDALALESLAALDKPTFSALQARIWQLLRLAACWQSPGMGCHFAAHEPDKSLAALQARAQRLNRRGAFRFGADDALALLQARARALGAARQAHARGLLRWAPWVHFEQLDPAGGAEGYAFVDGTLRRFRDAKRVCFVFAERRGEPWIVTAYPVEDGATCVA